MRLRCPAINGSTPSRRWLPEPVARTLRVPRLPWDATTRPITTGSEGSTPLVRDLHADPLPELDRGGLGDRADRPDRTPLPADDLAHIVRGHPELEVHPRVGLGGGDLDPVGLAYKRAGQNEHQLFELRHGAS